MYNAQIQDDEIELTLNKHKYPIATNVLAPRQWFVKTGEKRNPKKGEYFLSGTIPEVYLAIADESGLEYYIMQECEPPPSRIVVDGFIYQRIGVAQ